MEEQYYYFKLPWQ